MLDLQLSCLRRPNPTRQQVGFFQELLALDLPLTALTKSQGMSWCQARRAGFDSLPRSTFVATVDDDDLLDVTMLRGIESCNVNIIMTNRSKIDQTGQVMAEFMVPPGSAASFALLAAGRCSVSQLYIVERELAAEGHKLATKKLESLGQEYDSLYDMLFYYETLKLHAAPICIIDQPIYKWRHYSYGGCALQAHQEPGLLRRAGRLRELYAKEASLTSAG